MCVRQFADVIQLAAAAASGALLVLAFPPFGQAWLVLPCTALFLWSLRSSVSRRRAAAAGAVFGAAFFGLLFPWIGELGAIALIPLLLSQTAFTTLYGWGMGWVRTRPFPSWVPIAVGGWALMEWLRVRVPFGGFGWGLLGLPIGESAVLRPATSLFGVTGWSVIIVGAGALAVWAAIERTRSSLAALAAGLVVASALVFIGLDTASVPTGPDVRVAVIQGNSPCPGTHCPDEARLTFESHLDLTRTVEPGSVDLVVWAESVLSSSFDPVTQPEVAATLGAEAARIGATLLVGSDRAVGDGEFIRANIVIGPSGRVIGEYQKVHPVPFGEYIPLRPLFEWIPELDQVPRDMVRGSGPVRFDTGFGPFGSVISFESSFSRYPRDAVTAGARMLVIATTQNSYPYSRASDQLIGITRMHSAALGVDVVHAAVTGRSAIIVDDGEVADRTPLVEPAVLIGTVRLRMDALTPYARLGDWLQTVAVAAFVLTAVRWSRVRAA